MTTSTAARPPGDRAPRRTAHLVLWALQWALGAALVVAGTVKLVLPPDQVAQMFPWSVDVPALFTVTSALDVLGGLGVVLPALRRILPRLTVVAAAGVALLMVSAVVFYLVRDEAAEIVPNVVLGVVALVIVWGRARIAPITTQLPDVPRFTAHLPDARPPAGMEVAQLPTGSYDTRAALAFSGGRFSDVRAFASTAVLIRHPKGDILLDAGFGAHADEHIEMLPSFRRAPHAVGSTASEQLDAAGYDRDRLLGVVLTHSHWDHVSGLDSLDVPIWMTAPERAYAAASRGDAVFRAVSRGHDVHEYAFDGPAYLGFPSSHDVHGDGSIVLVPAAGHTTGSIIAFVTVPSGHRYAFIGDLTWQSEGISRRVQKPLLMRALADSDSARVRDDIARIVAIADRVQVVPAHDAAAYEGIPVLAPAARSAAPSRGEEAR